MEREYRACPSSYVVFGIIWGIPLVMVSVVLIRGADPSCWLCFAVSSLALASSVLAVGASHGGACHLGGSDRAGSCRGALIVPAG
jgi:hypothetical protein